MSDKKTEECLEKAPLQPSAAKTEKSRLFAGPTTDEETEYFNERKRRLRESEDRSSEDPSF